MFLLLLGLVLLALGLFVILATGTDHRSPGTEG
jgi:hypothetical protein